MQPEPNVIKIDPALPCGTITEKHKTCGKPSTVAHVYKGDSTKGQWTILPVCKDCSLAAIKVYEP